MELKTRRLRPFMMRQLAPVFLLLIFLSALGGNRITSKPTPACSNSKCTVFAGEAEFYVQGFERGLGDMAGEEFTVSTKCKRNQGWARRLLTGPGSSPPQCTSKCGKCKPCKPVHVPVPPPRTPITAEYYPEAWRCKCGNKLYIP
ncbi:uncharacterized protein LOC127798130 [Diospyros lotus]|uniref:uncharacterized protein LOC127798130 n=1 Tax=Diospyros lotus TaxID=55363 RepID=UPI0022548D96|nr:uncharacterized protein LOC127798130 [Diospyros lotus]